MHFNIYKMLRAGSQTQVFWFQTQIISCSPTLPQNKPLTPLSQRNYALCFFFQDSNEEVLEQ